MNYFLFKDSCLFCCRSWYLSVQLPGCSTNDLWSRIPNNVARGKVDDKYPVVPDAVARCHDGGIAHYDICSCSDTINWLQSMEE
jgi:hypothetical protein